MSMVPNSTIDYQWSETLQKFCKESCPDGKEWQHCVGLCASAAKLAINEAHRKIGTKEPPAALVARVMPALLESPVQGHYLRVIEIIDGVEQQVAMFNLGEEEREEFLPQWRAIGETRAMALRK